MEVEIEVEGNEEPAFVPISIGTSAGKHLNIGTFEPSFARMGFGGQASE